ncbi:Beta-barrel assembly machine subunit BamE [Nitrosomonas ureae]|uniref:Outer membrane protein assembly factor BamE n=1 Tax=Nitrosomonas ureae TaxID=44577 RepID=A0A285C0B2_9PROT|nr:outer membrane protein assembly factor BamE [Nitrosomonas ureae]SNX60899.1 Beta-barrel assembly machine subunit BamE [Nitrosomonas ureae]
MAVKFSALLIFLLFTGCSFLPHILYRIDVQQGNVVSDEMLEKLTLGMTKSQVLFVMGSPLIVDAFRENRWDYVYLMREKGDLIEHKRLTLFFENDTLINIENYMQFSQETTKTKPVERAPDKNEAQSSDEAKQ